MVEQRILAARARINEGPHVVAYELGLPVSTVHAVLRRHGKSRLYQRPKPGAVVRYERDRPGELLHVDIKKLGRIVTPGHRVTGDHSRRARGKAGWQYLFVCIDDHTRLAHAALYPDETADSAIDFITQALAFYSQHGIHAERVLTDNGSCFKNRWRDHLALHGIQHKRTRPYRPQTNGKAERFIRTMLERWAYAYSYPDEHARAAQLPHALDFYNRFRPHRALRGLTPLQRVNNVSGTYT